MFLLGVLRAAAPLPWLSEDLSAVLLEIVRDNSRREGTRRFALDAYIHTRQDSKEETGELGKLLADIHEGRVPDPDRELLGKLLSRLYPEWLAPSEVWDYLREMPETKGGHGIYLVLWFCKDHAQPTPPSGAPPANAQELKARLQATLTHEETRKITVCVTDVSPPGGREQKTAGHD